MTENDHEAVHFNSLNLMTIYHKNMLFISFYTKFSNYNVTVKSRGRTQTETPHQMTLDVNLSGT
jgi:hypothetical protein